MQTAHAGSVRRTPQESMHWKLTLGEEKNPLPNRRLEPATNWTIPAPTWGPNVPTYQHACSLFRHLVIQPSKTAVFVSHVSSLVIQVQSESIQVIYWFESCLCCDRVVQCATEIFLFFLLFFPPHLISLAVTGPAFPSLISLMVYMYVKHHVYLLIIIIITLI